MDRGSCFRRNDGVKALAFSDLFSVSPGLILPGGVQDRSIIKERQNRVANTGLQIPVYPAGISVNLLHVALATLRYYTDLLKVSWKIRRRYLRGRTPARHLLLPYC